MLIPPLPTVDAGAVRGYPEGMSDQCNHLDSVQTEAFSGNGCVDCERIGASWVHPRRYTTWSAT